MTAAIADTDPGTIEKTRADVAVDGAASDDTVAAADVPLPETPTTDTTKNAAANEAPARDAGNDNVADDSDSDSETEPFSLGYTEDPFEDNAATLDVWHDDPSFFYRLAIPGAGTWYYDVSMAEVAEIWFQEGRSFGGFINQFDYRLLRFDPWAL